MLLSLGLFIKMEYDSAVIGPVLSVAICLRQGPAVIFPLRAQHEVFVMILYSAKIQLLLWKLYSVGIFLLHTFFAGSD